VQDGRQETNAQTKHELVDTKHELVDAEEFKQLFRFYAAGVAVVTVGSDCPYGLTITSLASVSADPPVAVFSIGTDASAWPALAAEDDVAINLLAEDQAEVSRRFAERGVDRFAGVDWFRLPTGEAVLHGVHGWLRGRISHRIPVGSSFLITVDVGQVWVDPDRGPLIFYDRQHHRLGDNKQSAVARLE
jgi:flavin reductase (DIM6/NTAB) family NADH-FMN oxidoreductase RutF